MADVKIDVQIESKPAVKSLNNIRKATVTFGKDAKKSFGRATNAFDVFKGALGAQLAIGAIKSLSRVVIGFGSNAVSAAADMETMEVGFATLLKSADAAKSLLGELQQFTATTPFRLEGVASAAQQLLAFGFQADTIIDRLKNIGDVAAGSNSDLKEVALIYGQVAAAGKLTGERLLQFQERAIPIGPAIAKTMGIAETAVKDTVSKGKVSLSVFEKAFQSLSKEGGLFFGATIKQSKTFNGVISTLQDNFQLLAADIGEKALPAIKDFSLALIELIQENKTEITGFFNSMINYSKDFSKGLVGIGAALKDAFPDETQEKINKIDKQVFVLTDGIANLKVALDKVKSGDSSGFFGKLFGDARSAKTIEKQMREQINSVQKLIEARRELTSGSQKSSDDESANEITKVKEKNQKIIEAEKEKFAFLDALKQERLLKEEEQRLTEDLSKDENNSIILERLSTNLKAQEELRKKYSNEDKKIAKNLTEFKKKENDKREQDEKNSLSSLFTLDKAAAANKAANLRSSLNTISTLQNSENKRLFMVGKAAAIADATISGIQGVMKAWALGPILGPPLAGLVATASALNVSKIASQKPPQGFADGGIVGATAGVDNTVISAREGEMFLNAQQQKSLFDSINGSGLGGSGDVVVAIDGREVFRAVKEQLGQGLQLQGA